jgi:hypothetical protein
MSRPRPYLPASVLRAIREAVEEEALCRDFSQSYIIALCVAQVFGIDIQAAIDAREPVAYVPRLRLPTLPQKRPSKTRH